MKFLNKSYFESLNEKYWGEKTECGHYKTENIMQGDYNDENIKVIAKKQINGIKQ